MRKYEKHKILISITITSVSAIQAFNEYRDHASRDNLIRTLHDEYQRLNKACEDAIKIVISFRTSQITDTQRNDNPGFIQAHCNTLATP